MLFGSQLFTPEFGIGEPAVSVAQALREPDFAATWQSVHDAGHLASWLAFAALCCGDSARRHPPITSEQKSAGQCGLPPRTATATNGLFCQNKRRCGI